ncbi:MAG: DEAD/DEAH box helicase [Methanomicrobiales archaeon]|nr:DEAD/DEAH box helicase [Methanomicrobiales archaeon]NYT20930.1 DEAD/DEAH box helicase [Methanomicrobiales archaeon]
MAWITHPLVRPGSLESRAYQLSIAMRALDGNTMVVLPTGLGKTAVALLVAASRLYNEGGRVMMLAPTKPLVEQHYRFFRKFLVTGDDEKTCVVFTGETPPDERRRGFSDATVIFATPQVIKNDLLAGAYTLGEVSLLIVDECHRAVGNYAYVFIAGRYRETARSPLILAMTASPGGKEEKVQEVCRNLGIGIIETRSEHDPDVAPYIHEREIEVIEVPLPVPLKAAVDDLNDLLEKRLARLREFGYAVPRRQQLSMKSLQFLNAQIQERIHERDSAGYAAASIYAEVMKLRHAVSLAESQGSRVLAGYVNRLYSEGTTGGGSKAAGRLARDPVFIRLRDRCMSWTDELHPKMEIMAGVTRKQLSEFPESRIIIFASFRDMVQQIVDFLNARGIPAERFVGQATRDTERGLSQKKQIEALDRFRAGTFRVLVATSVGEEGLDVPSTDMVIFYEAVPSEIRSIQRKGRTGRSGSGRVVVLVTKGTSDETFRFVSQSREKAMASGIRRIGVQMETAPAGDPVEGLQKKIDEFTDDKPEIVVDDRETSSHVVERLSDLGARITIRRLESGDYAVGDRILVERKRARDFVDTLVDRDLFGQLKELAAQAIRPVLIIEGGDLYSQRDIHPNALRGTLAALSIDFGIAILFSRDEEDTAQLLMVIARREGERGDRAPRFPARKASASFQEEMEMIIASYPDIGLKNARSLLEEFGSIRAVTGAEEEDLARVRGIGEKRAHRIFELSRKSYR